MKISDLLKLSTDNLRRRKGRTVLTLIGVVIGTCLIVVMISLGIALNQQYEEMLKSYGDLTKIEIYNRNFFGGGKNENAPPVLDDEMLETIKSIPHVIAATPQYQAENMYAQVFSGKGDRYESYFDANGMDPSALEALGVTLVSGSYLTGEEALGKNKIPVLVGENFGYNFEDTRKSYNSGKRHIFPGQMDAKGEPLPPFVDIQNDKMILRMDNGDENNRKVREYELVVVGVMKSDYNAGYYTDSGVVMSIANMKHLEKEFQKISGNSQSGGVVMIGPNGPMSEKDNGYKNVYVKIDDVKNVEAVEKQIKEMGYNDIQSLTQVREEMQKQVRKQQFTLGGLAAVSLLVAALNIANTMTMAIYERTKEIGVMKVLGCELGKIRGMFLIESGTIGFLGGIIGVIISYLVSFIINNLQTIVRILGIGANNPQNDMSMGMGMGMGMESTMTGASSIIPIWLVFGAILFATLIGLVSGIIPANKAVKISALEAIRRE